MYIGQYNIAVQDDQPAVAAAQAGVANAQEVLDAANAKLVADEKTLADDTAAQAAAEIAAKETVAVAATHVVTLLDQIKAAVTTAEVTVATTVSEAVAELEKLLGITE